MKKIEILALVFLTVCSHKCCFSKNTDSIKIGGLFDGTTEDAKNAFLHAIDIANSQRKSWNLNKSIEVITDRIEYGNEYHASESVCKMLRRGVMTILGPSAPQSSIHIENICDLKEIPLIETRVNTNSKLPVVNLHPNHFMLDRALTDIIKAWNWKNFVVLFESPSWLAYISQVLKMASVYHYTPILFQLDTNFYSNGHYRDVLTKAEATGETRILIACSIDVMADIFEQLQQIGIINKHYSYIVTSLDFHTLDLRPYQYSGVNITGFRIVNPEKETVKKFSKTIEKSMKSKGKYFPEGFSPDKLRLETALAYDSALLFTETIKRNKAFWNPKFSTIECEVVNSTWNLGSTFSNIMNDISIDGLTGRIKFDQKGYRSDFILELIELNNGIKSIGTWNVFDGLHLMRTFAPPPKIKQELIIPEDDVLIFGKHLKVLVSLSTPYVILNDNRLQGFAIDLIHELSKLLEFNYTFYVQEDGAYGSMNEYGEWNGMMREIIEKRFDLGITDLTITSQRESAVDFTVPFMNLGISILYRKPKAEPSLSPYMILPFSIELWMYIGLAVIVVSVTLVLIGRLTPGEWINPHPCNKPPTYLENQFGFLNSLWFTLSGLLQQRTNVSPKTLPTRIIAACWWFFALILVALYIAKLTELFIHSSPKVISYSMPFADVEDLCNLNGTIPFGAKSGGSTLEFFKNSDSPAYQSMFKWMMDHPEYLTASNEDGITRAKNEPYAFFMESSTIDFVVERECGLQRVGNLLDSKGYGIAMKKYSPYRGHLSQAILRMQQNGQLGDLIRKWWKEKLGGGTCTEDKEDMAEKLTMPIMMTLFICLITGCIVALVLALIVMFCNSNKRSKQFNIPYCDIFCNDLCFCMSCDNKRVERKPKLHRNLPVSKKPTYVPRPTSKHSFEIDTTI